MSKSKLTVHSEAYNDKGVMDSVMELFEGIITPGSSGQGRTRQKIEEHVLWARFDDCDLNDTFFNSELVNIHQTQQEDYTPLVLLLGTTAGLQIWCIDPKGEAHLLMVYYEALVQHAKILPAPELKDSAGDAYASRRPILVLSSVPHGSVNGRCNAVSFISLRNKEDLRPTTYDREVKAILGNKRFVVVCMNSRLVIYNNHDLKERITIINSVAFNDGDSCPIALGSRWLAFGDRKHEPLNQSLGGITTENVGSYTSKLINVVDVVMQGLSYIGESAVNTWSSTGAGGAGDRRLSTGANSGTPVAGRHHGGRTPSSGEATPSTDSPGEEGGPGFVSVVDLYKLSGLAYAEPVNVHHTDSYGLVAHFPAHANAVVAYLRFDGSGQLLFSACRQGRDFHIYRLLPHPKFSQQTAVHHLYVLHRGDTTAQVADVTFAADSRWVAVSTRHGTTHIFPLTPYGGPISARTHAQSRVVNRTSRFLQSAGVDERTTVASQSGRESPASRGQAVASNTGIPRAPIEPCIAPNAPYHNATNPRLPPFPLATQVVPHLQIKQTYATINKWRSVVTQWYTERKASNIINNSVNMSSNVGNAAAGQEINVPLPLVACFSHPRARLAGQTPNTSYVRERERESKPPLDALFLITCDGRVVEHFLDVRPRRDRPLSGSSNSAGPFMSTGGGMQQWAGYPKDGPIDLQHSPRAQWVLSRLRAIANASATSHSARSVHVPAPPLTSSHPLVASAEGVQQQRRNSSAGTWVPLSSTPSSHCGSDFPSDGFGRTASSDSLAHRPPSVDSLPSSEASESESWLAHVEIVTHSGPHRRLWMGPQFTFKTYQSSTLIGSTSASSVILTSADSNSIQSGGEEENTSGDSTGLSPGMLGSHSGLSQHTRSHPLPAPRSAPRGRNTSGSPRASCVYIEAGSFNDSYGSVFEGLEGSVDEEAIRESLAEAMLEPRSIERRSTPAREFIQESDFQNESWSSGSDCLGPDSGRIGHRMQFP